MTVVNGSRVTERYLKRWVIQQFY